MEKINLIGIIAGLVMIVGSLVFLRDTKLLYFIIVLAFVLMALPFVVSLILQTGVY